MKGLAYVSRLAARIGTCALENICSHYPCRRARLTVSLQTKLEGRRVCPDCSVAFNVADVNLEGGRFVMPPMLPTSEACIKNR